MEKLKCINLGCGDKKKESNDKEEWINIDFRKEVNPDLIFDFGKEKLPYKENEIDKIVADDFLEHFEQKTLMNILSELNHILKVDGTLEIKSPNLDKIIRAYPGTLDSFGLDRKIFGGRDYKGNFHKIGFTKDSLEFYLMMSGFKVKSIEEGTLNDWSNLIVEVSKPDLERWLEPQIKVFTRIIRSKDILTTPRAKVAIDLINKQNPKKMLDICGQEQWLARGLRKEGFKGHITGFDMPEVVDSYDYSEIGDFKIVKGRVDNINFEEKFDCICAFELLEHIFLPYNLLKEVRKIIEDDGVLLISTPNGKELSLKHPSHWQWFDIRRLEILFNLTGFKFDKAYDLPDTLFVVAKPI